MGEVKINCRGEEILASVSTNIGVVPRIELVGVCGQLDEDNRCKRNREYCFLKTRPVGDNNSYDDWDDGEEEIIDLDEDDI